MNLVEKLLKADVEKAEELERKTIQSKRLAKILGEKKAIDIVIEEIPAKRYNEIIAMQLDKKGNLDANQLFQAKAIILVEGVVEPNLKDESLMKYFKCATPKELAIKLFSNEVNKISDEIVSLSDTEINEDEVKN